MNVRGPKIGTVDFTNEIKEKILTLRKKDKQRKERLDLKKGKSTKK